MNGLAFSSHGVRIGIRVDSDDYLEHLEPCLPSWRSPITGSVQHLYSLSGMAHRTNQRRGVRRYFSLHVQGVLVAKSLDLEEVLDLLSAELELVVAITSPSRLFVHAGVISWRGKAYLFPASSGQGKSTLIEELESRGALVFSDEFAVLDQRARVFPHARSPRLGSRPRSPSSSMFPAPRRSLSIGGVIATRYRAGGPTRLRRLGEAKAWMALFRHALGVSRKPDRALSILTAVIPNVPTWQGPRGEGAEAASSILDLLDRNQAPRREPANSS